MTGSIRFHNCGKIGAPATDSSLMPVSRVLNQSKGCSGSTRENILLQSACLLPRRSLLRSCGYCTGWAFPHQKLYILTFCYPCFHSLSDIFKRGIHLYFVSSVSVFTFSSADFSAISAIFSAASLPKFSKPVTLIFRFTFAS